ncbi:hypothetical protein AVEN_178453-1 [Araneus ventricosus]|uniref:Uncharacterized protein n=1 Tax=Araneus ventricosus TaxID=182803 RepID=A0A4Y2T8R6_ARAVE|nr:hypothetical protein AVEN_178453-1 [Araneus ventricosus]
MKKTTPELTSSPSPNFRTTPAVGRLTHDACFNVHQAHIYGESCPEALTMSQRVTGKNGNYFKRKWEAAAQLLSSSLKWGRSSSALTERGARPVSQSAPFMPTLFLSKSKIYSVELDINFSVQREEWRGTFCLKKMSLVRDRRKGFGVITGICGY